MHVHVHSADGEAKFWVDPEIEVAESHGFTTKHLAKIRELVEAREHDIRTAWKRHFGS